MNADVALGATLDELHELLGDRVLGEPDRARAARRR